MTKAIESLVNEAIEFSKDKKIDLYTFGVYHDHESGLVSICIDTKANSEKQLLSSRQYTLTQFKRCVAEKDLEMAALWQANVSRNFSLGDFSFVNCVEFELSEKHEADDEFYLGLINSILDRERDILGLSQSPEEVVFCASSADEEVGFIWVAGDV